MRHILTLSNLIAGLGFLPDGTYTVTSQDGEIALEDANLTDGYIVSARMPDVLKDRPRDRAIFALGAAVEGSCYFGVWTDTDGTRYFDVSWHACSQTAAYAYARHNLQAAIWDIGNACEIRTGLAGT